MTDISLYDFLFKFCDEYQLISVTIVDADEKWCKFTGINSMPVWEVAHDEKFKDILEMSVSFIRTLDASGRAPELYIEVMEEEP